MRLGFGPVRGIDISFQSSYDSASNVDSPSGFTRLLENIAESHPALTENLDAITRDKVVKELKSQNLTTSNLKEMLEGGPRAVNSTSNCKPPLTESDLGLRARCTHADKGAVKCL